MKKILKILLIVLEIAVVVVLLQQIIIAVMPEGRKAENDNEVYHMEVRKGTEPFGSSLYHLKFSKINKSTYDVQYSKKIEASFDSTSGKIVDYEVYCEICKNLEITQTYSNTEADYIVWKEKGHPKYRMDVVHVIARDDMELATVYMRIMPCVFRSKNRPGRIIIIPIEKGIVENVYIGDAYRFDFEKVPVN
jgi:hypothetical protein